MARIEKWDEVHGNQALDEKKMAFLDSTTDQYAILQLRRSEDTVYERFSSMRELERMGLAAKRSGRSDTLRPTLTSPWCFQGCG